MSKSAINAKKKQLVVMHDSFLVSVIGKNRLKREQILIERRVKDIAKMSEECLHWTDPSFAKLSLNANASFKSSKMCDTLYDDVRHCYYHTRNNSAAILPSVIDGHSVGSRTPVYMMANGYETCTYTQSMGTSNHYGGMSSESPFVLAYPANRHVSLDCIAPSLFVTAPSLSTISILDMKEVDIYYVAGDNIDLTISPTYMSKENQRKSVHWFLDLLIKKRVHNISLSNSKPKCDILSISAGYWLPTDYEIASHEKHIQYHIARVLLKFRFLSRLFNDIFPQFIEHPYMDTTKLTSEIRVAHLHEANENTSDGMISILQVLHDTFVLRDNQSHPNVLEKTEFAGDVLTTERAFNAQMSMGNGCSSYENLSGLNYRPGGLHTLMNIDMVFCCT